MSVPRVDAVEFVGATYALEIAETRTVEAPDGEEVHAFVDLSESRMVLGSGSERRARLLLLHEALHVIDYETPGGRKLKEPDIRRLSTCLLHFFESNPELARWLVGGKK